MFAFDIVSSDMWLQLALSRLGSEALLLCNYSQWLRHDLFESLPAAAVTCATDSVRLPPSPFPSPPTTPHTAGASLAFVMSVGDSVPWCRCRVTPTHRSRLSAVKILGNYCVAVYCDTKLISCRRTLKLCRKLRCDTAYWQH